MELLSVVISIYNEEDVIEQMAEQTQAVLSQLAIPYEMIFVNDGSQDRSEAILTKLCRNSKRIKAIHFSRNFGHEAAMIAGIDYAKGDMILCMDGDLQHPPQSIPDMIDVLRDGYDVVLMNRKENQSSGFLKRCSSKLFYWVFNLVSSTKLERDVSDFFALSKRAAKVLQTEYRENNRYMRGYIQTIGFATKKLTYVASERMGGKSKYSLKKLFNVAMSALTCFSRTPLRLGIYLGMGSGVLSVLLFLYYVIGFCIHGYGNGMVLLCFFLFLFFTLLFMVLGIIGEHIAVLLDEVKKRPIYIVREKENL
ncbi:MAG: glycosyltransferase family 2 protein [Lachnospiraceae bacterium]